MNKETFKAGDEVYCPQMGKLIYKVFDTNQKPYCLKIEGFGSVTNTGRIVSCHLTQSIFHATPENKALLEALYKCEFESPKLKGSDLTRKLLGEGKHVLCYVSDISDESICNAVGIVSSLRSNKFITKTGNSWRYAVPCNDYANLVDGVLEVKG